MTQHTLPRRTLLAAAAGSLLLAACGGGSDDLDDRLNISGPRVRYVHAAPAAPNVTFFRNGVAEPESSNVSYRFATVYKDISSGSNTLDVRLTSVTGTALGSTAINAERGHKYTGVALADVGGAAFIVIDDPYNKRVNDNDARLRFVNGSVNAAPLDIYVTAPAVDINTVSPTLSSLGYRQVLPASGADSVEQAAGTYLLRITTAGTKTVIFTATLTLTDNQDLLLITEPTDNIGATPNAIKLLRVLSDDSSQTGQELLTS